jgi:chemotaxis protein CheX
MQTGMAKIGRTMTQSLRRSLDVISDPGSLDASVAEVFGLMLDVRCKRIGDAGVGDASTSDESVTGVVGFGGALSGACVFRCDALSARTVASRMTGIEFKKIDNTVKDAIGELCNMLAGTWKGRVPELSANCGLSVPAVITGRDYRLHVQAPEFQLHQNYRFENASFSVTIICDGLQ